jgi:hypothetical protein
MKLIQWKRNTENNKGIFRIVIILSGSLSQVDIKFGMVYY